ncbi:MAG: RND family efflux transporter MFP subunit [Limisphaerales bacterium]|nr:MAG: RND family efflux transporter MFP subunit [Limisphaerales bacterium]KAG0507013.1 MAG: RND family efflux transporter MFP subunit [Limisphaerales bacterium]TXT49408.1 MAG: RND family efflux transporter MFP subunit [Limisphaerales bacterium]
MKPLPALLFALAAASLPAADAPKAASPAHVGTLVKETDLNIIKLTPQAEKRLGIVTVAVERKSVPRTRSFGGDVMIRAGSALTVTAPIAATVSGTLPQPGVQVKRGQALFQLLPILSPTERVNVATALSDAQSSVAGAKALLEAARVTLARAERLVKAEAGSQRAVDDARAAVAVGEANLKAAETRVVTFAAVLKDFEAGSVTALPVTAPLDGLVMAVRTSGAQQVASGAVLLEITALDPLWVRVPVYAGEVNTLQPNATVQVTRLGARPGDVGAQAKPAAAPPSANALANTVDFYFELANADGRFRPGERVSVSLPLTTAENNLVVPWTAVLHDIHGGQWVYEQTAPQTFVRRRVTVERVAAKDAVLAAGPGVDAKIVTDGAVELFGTELGTGK